jgi:hypothetical protein
MSFLHRGERRRGKLAAALTTVGAVAAFQALAIVGAGSASAVGNCTYNPATDTVQITINAGTISVVSVQSPGGEVLFDGAACGSASNANTTSIVVLGQPSTNEAFIVDNFTGLQFNTAITWAIDLGTGTGDAFGIVGADSADTITVTNSSFDINGGGGELNGVEFLAVAGQGGADTIDGSGATIPESLSGAAGDDTLAAGTASDNTVTFPAFGPFPGGGVYGGAGVDTVNEGAVTNGNDILNGGGDNGDFVDYSGRTTDMVLNAALGAALQDTNGNGAADVGEEVDQLIGFNVFATGSGDDTITGAAGAETFIPGDGDDAINGGAGPDILDYSTSTAAMTIDPAAGTATGQGADTFTSVEGFIGSAFDDTLVWPGVVTPFDGGDGVDTIDASAMTTAQAIDLSLVVAGNLVYPNVENLIGGSGNDTLIGNAFANQLWGNDGNDALSGGGGNDWMDGGAGNDSFTGGAGADTVTFEAAPAGVTADVSLGYASGYGDDSFGDFVEIIKGSDFADDITGGQTGFGGSLNMVIKGRKGNDNLTGSDSNDTLKGGAGNDQMRGGAGSDTLVGGKGKKDEGWGGKGTDFCKGIEKEHSCEGKA